MSRGERQVKSFPGQGARIACQRNEQVRKMNHKTVNRVSDGVRGHYPVMSDTFSVSSSTFCCLKTLRLIISKKTFNLSTRSYPLTVLVGMGGSSDVVYKGPIK